MVAAPDTLICAGDVGNISDKVMPSTWDELLLVMLMVNVDVPPPAMETGLKDLVRESGEEMVA